MLTTLRYFRDEYEAHIDDHRCPARACDALIAYAIDPDACTGCTLCVKKCPVDAITGEKKQLHIDRPGALHPLRRLPCRLQVRRRRRS